MGRTVDVNSDYVKRGIVVYSIGKGKTHQSIVLIMQYRIVVLIGLLVATVTWAERAPQLMLEQINGSTFLLEEALLSGPVVFDIWATWCKPCVKSLSKMQEVAEGYKSKGVQFLTINVDGPRNRPKVRLFMRRHGIQLPVLLDYTNEILQLFHLAGVPATLVIASDGTVFYRHEGYRLGDTQKIIEKLNELLAFERK